MVISVLSKCQNVSLKDRGPQSGQCANKCCLLWKHTKRLLAIVVQNASKENDSFIEDFPCLFNNQQEG